jgi:uncharacterized protein involved in exopolysaccharide biosynthesis
MERDSRFSTMNGPMSVSLRDLAAPLFRRKRVLAATFLLVFALAVIGLMRLHKYESHMEILVGRERADPLVTTEATSPVGDSTPVLTAEEVNSEAELLKSRDVLENVVMANDARSESQSGRLDQAEADRLARGVRELASNIKVDTSAKTHLIGVTYSSSNPTRAYEVLKSLGDNYLAKHAVVHRPAGSYEFFAKQAESYKAALDRSEARLRSFGETHGVADPEEESKNLAQQLAMAVGQMHATEQAIAANEQRIRSDEEQLKATPARSTEKQETAVANLLLQNLGTTLLAAETKRAQLLLKYEPSYPLVREAEQEVASAKAAIAAAEKAPYVNQTTDRDPTFELLREDAAKSSADLAGQRASLAANQRSISNMQSQMVTLAGQSLQLADLERDAKANEQNYLLYLSKREQERTSDALDRTRIENVAIAVPPAIPVLPAHSILYVLALALGLALIVSLATAYMFDYVDSSFHTPDQVVESLRIPIVIALPKRSA